jgi:hypothetical protein
MPRKVASSKPPALLSRKEATGLAKRFLKSDDLFDAQRDLMVLYKYFKEYPNRDFWMNYELPFKLNALLWFLGQDGRDQLLRDWNVFNLDFKPQGEYKLEEVKQGQDMVIEKKPRTIADLLK